MAQQLGSNYYNSPFKFNGKELDEETGFYYYGARYYDPKISIWLSVDPLAEKFPNFNPYNYVMQNPLNLIDPTGMAPEEGGATDPPKGATAGATYNDPDNGKLTYNGSTWQRADGAAVLNEVVMVGVKNTGKSFLDDGAKSRRQLPAEYMKNTLEVINFNPILNSPVGNSRISSLFLASRSCKECSKTHGGTDYAVSTGTEIKAMTDGVAERVYRSNTYGNTVILNHGTTSDGDFVYTLYGHGSKHKVKQGDVVKAGQVIMLSGNTGNSTGPHLHLEVVKTKFSPSSPNFFGNLKLRYGPSELPIILKK